MHKFYFFDELGSKNGPYNLSQLEKLTTEKTILPKTVIEYHQKRYYANQISQLSTIFAVHEQKRKTFCQILNVIKFSVVFVLFVILFIVAKKNDEIKRQEKSDRRSESQYRESNYDPDYNDYELFYPSERMKEQIEQGDLLRNAIKEYK